MTTVERLLYNTLKENVGVFGQICLPSVYEDNTPPFHTEIYSAMLNDSQKLTSVAAPRGTAKSTLVSLVLPLHRALFKEEGKDEFIIIISEALPQSKNFLSTIKEMLNTSQELIDIFGDFGEKTAIRWREEDIILKNGVRILALGTGQRIRGSKSAQNRRPTLIIMDDVESELNANTREARIKNKKWITEAVIPSLDKKRGRIIMIGTVISDDCFLCWTRDSKSWFTLWYSIIKPDGTSLWNEMYPLDEIAKIRESMASIGNVNGFFQEYMNQSQAPETAPFQPTYIRTHNYTLKRDAQFEWYLEGDTLGRADDEITRIPVDLYQGTDPASSLSDKADFFVLVTLAVDAEANFYIIDMVRDKIPTEKQPQLIFDKYIRYRPKKSKIETVSYQEALRRSVMKLMQDSNEYIPGLEKGVKPRNPKSERLLSLVSIFARGKFFFRSQDILSQQEFLSYPRGKYDDTMDAIWTAMQGLLPCRRTEIALVPEEEEAGYGDEIDWMIL